MNKYLNKRYEEDLTEIERMSMHQPATFDSTYASIKVRMRNSKTKKIKTTSEEARFFGEETKSEPKRKRVKRAREQHDLQKDMARPVQRKDHKYKNAAEVGIDKAKQKKTQPGKDWVNEVVRSPPNKIRMIVAENELPSSTKSFSKNVESSKKPPKFSKKVTNKNCSDKVTKPFNQLHKSAPSHHRPRSENRQSKSDKKSSSRDKNVEKPKKSLVSEPKNPHVQETKRMSRIEELRMLLKESPSAEPEHVRKTFVEQNPEPATVQQKSVLDDLGFSSSQESNASEVESLPKACEICKSEILNTRNYCCSSVPETEIEIPELPEQIVRMEIREEQPSEIIDITDDDVTEIPPCPPLVEDGYESDDDLILVSVTGPSANENDRPLFHDENTGTTFCYGQDLDEF